MQSILQSNQINLCPKHAPPEQMRIMAAMAGWFADLAISRPPRGPAVDGCEKATSEGVNWKNLQHDTRAMATRNITRAIPETTAADL